MEQRTFLKTLCGIMLALAIAACTGGPAASANKPAVSTASADQLDVAIRETSDYLNKQLPKGNKLVILNIQSEYPALSEYIIDELIANTVNDRVFLVVDRQQLDTIRAELDFQYSGEVDDDTMQALGRMAGAQIIVSGAVSKIGDLYRLRVRALGVQTAQIEGQFNRNIPDGPTIAALARSQATGYGDSGGRPVAKAASQPGAAQAAASVASDTTGVPQGMVLVPAGTFSMGSNEGRDHEMPVHQVTISKPFFMGKYEVTQKEWIEIMGTNPSGFKGNDLPVEQVSWHEAIDYCNKRSRAEGLVPAYSGNENNIICNFQASVYRLPTEAEWEWAAKGGGKDSMIYLYSGSSNMDAVAWNGSNSGDKTHPVGMKAPNSLGIYDMSGNIYEWCWDWYGAYSSGAQTDPEGVASGSNRVSRGGCWYKGYQPPRSATRSSDPPSFRENTVGFRLLRPSL
jgi:formylglycine-generating enzyme required for sulfatase activity